MRIFTTIFLLHFLAAASFGQTPFTINAGNFPIYGIQNFDRNDAPTGINLAPSANGNWDFSTANTNVLAANYFVEETDPAYTSLGIDVYLSDFKLLNANLGYEVFYEYDFNNQGVFESAIYVGEQTFPLTLFTGGANDEMFFPLQGSFFQGGRQIMKFPATFQSAWKSKSRRAVDFNLTVAAAGLDNTPCQHVFTVTRADTVSGWGKMRVHSSGGPSIAYDVLIDQSTTSTQDSFYVAGSPAPAQLLQVFAATQGQTSVVNRLTAYRPGNSTPLGNFFFSNNSFTSPFRVLFDVDNVGTVGVNDGFVGGDFSTLLFPNPSVSGEINFQITGEKAPKMAAFEVLDLQGRIIKTGKTDGETSLLQLHLGDQNATGEYVLRVFDEKGNVISAEPFLIQKK